MKQYYESEVLFQLMERDGFNIPSSVPPYEAEIKAYLINQVKQAYPKLTDYEAEWLLYNYTKHLPAEFPISSVSDVTEATFENVVPFAYQSAILKGCTKYRDIETGEILEVFEDGRNLELVSVKMPVLTTTGKNLFDKNSVIMDYVVFSDGTLSSSEGNGVTDFIKVSKGKTYVKNDGKSSLAVYRSSKTFIKRVSSTNTYTSSDDGYIRWNISAIRDVMDTLQIEEGSTTTSYEPYKTNILTTNEEVELRGIGDVQDTLDCLTGELTQRIDEIVLDGSESWEYHLLTNTDTVAYRTVITRTSSYSPVLCDRFINQTGSEDTEHCFIGASNIVIFINRSRLSTVNIPDFKKYLQSNPLTIQYRLANESIKTVDLKTINEKGETTYFMPLEGTMYVQSSGEIIQPTFDMSVPVEATTQNLASFIELEMGNNHE